MNISAISIFMIFLLLKENKIQTKRKKEWMEIESWTTLTEAKLLAGHSQRVIVDAFASKAVTIANAKVAILLYWNEQALVSSQLHSPNRHDSPGAVNASLLGFMNDLDMAKSVLFKSANDSDLPMLMSDSIEASNLIIWNE